MVSFWPWRRDDSSPASFEKTLSALSGKISKQATSLDTRRNQARRVRALWTLYAAMAYVVYLVVAVLVVGWRSWGPVEYGVATSGPLVVYGVRRGLDAAFGWRVGAAETRLQELKSQRDKTIAQLKEATRYDSTQALLDKYAGEKGARKRTKAEAQDGSSPSTPARSQDQKPRTTGFAPPPTANIPGRQSLPAHFSPGWHGPAPGQGQGQSAPNTPQRDPLAPSASFAPNAFPGTPQAANQAQAQAHSPSHPRSPLSQQMSPPTSPGPGQGFGHGDDSEHHGSSSGSGSAWYERLLDVLLGDDEAAARNRLALLCTSCGVVNGLAPPGIKTAAELGRWRCSSCGAWNGVAKEAADSPGEGNTKDKGGGKKRLAKRRDTMDAVVQEIRDATGVSAAEIRRRMGDVPVPMEREAVAVAEEDEKEESEESDYTIYSDEEQENKAGEHASEDEEEEEEEEEQSSPAKATRSRKAKDPNAGGVDNASPTKAKASGKAKSKGTRSK